MKSLLDTTLRGSPNHFSDDSCNYILWRFEVLVQAKDRRNTFSLGLHVLRTGASKAKVKEGVLICKLMMIRI